MRDSRCQSVRGMFLMLFTSVCCTVLTLLLSSCSPVPPLQREDQPAKGGEFVVPYSIVFVIHGDGNYLYHDTSGNEYEADEEAVANAKRVARRNPQAEVFIFHRKARRHLLFVFPLPDGEFYYYRNGELIAHESYWRDQEQSHFNPEVGLYGQFRVPKQPGEVSLFLYFGHEIPEVGGAGYDASSPDRTFTVHDLADGLKGFTRQSARFDLMVLSTCFGGTPYTIGTLGPFARTIIASPDNLHLSYVDLNSLERLDLRLQDGDVPGFARKFALQAFDRLRTDIQTTVSIAVYDVDRVQAFLRSVDSLYEHTLTTLKPESRVSMATVEHCDCADLPAFGEQTMNEGVDVFFRPARFGRSKRKQSHSGWECWKESGSDVATSQTAEPVPK